MSDETNATETADNPTQETDAPAPTETAAQSPARKSKGGKGGKAAKGDVAARVHKITQKNASDLLKAVTDKMKAAENPADVAVLAAVVRDTINFVRLLHDLPSVHGAN